MIDDFKRIKKELFNTIAENEITIKKLNKQIREDNGKVLIKDVSVINTTEAESENRNVKVTVRLNLLKNGKVEFKI
jgi:hypothetical protein